MLKKPNDNSPKKKRYYSFNCPKCGTYTTKVKSGGKHIVWLCHSCVRKTVSTEQFINKAKQKFGDKYDYSVTEYADSRQKVAIRCLKHGIFYMRPGDHLSKRKPGDCPICSKENGDRKKRLSVEEWKQRLHKRYGNKIQLIKYTDVSYHAPVIFHCEVHGEFTSTFGQITHTSYFCPECARMVPQLQSFKNSVVPQKATLYYVYLPQIDMYKLGVTTLHRSSSLSGEEAEEVFSVELPLDVARHIEFELHSQLTHLRYSGRQKLIKAGNTELYKVDILSEIHKKLEATGLHRGNSMSKPA